MPMRCYFLTRQVTIKFWPVYKSRLIFWTDFEDLKGRLIHRKIRYVTKTFLPSMWEPLSVLYRGIFSFWLNLDYHPTVSKIPESCQMPIRFL